MIIHELNTNRWWIDTLNPLAGVQFCCWCPAFVPIALYPHFIIEISFIGLKHSAQTTTVAQLAAVGPPQYLLFTQIVVI